MEQTELVTLLEAVDELNRAQTALLGVALGELAAQATDRGDSGGLKRAAQSFERVDDLLALLMALAREDEEKDEIP